MSCTTNLSCTSISSKNECVCAHHFILVIISTSELKLIPKEKQKRLTLVIQVSIYFMQIHTHAIAVIQTNGQSRIQLGSVQSIQSAQTNIWVSKAIEHQHKHSEKHLNNISNRHATYNDKYSTRSNSIDISRSQLKLFLSVFHLIIN